jgi:GT2 family glycosyltransferase
MVFPSRDTELVSQPGGIVEAGKSRALNEQQVTFDIAAVVATGARTPSLRRMLESVAALSMQPAQIVIVDSSDDSQTRRMCELGIPGLRCPFRWLPAIHKGAAAQRNRGVKEAAEPFVWFVDDDIRMESDCLAKLHEALAADSKLGGVSATIVNQRYQAPGRISRSMFALMQGRFEPSFAGKVIGPAVNLLPDDREDLPKIAPVQWLNTTCTLYRREALPDPPFEGFFTGYSLMEDLALSLTVAKRGWKLANVRTARIFHDSQSGAHKSNVEELARMELVNRHYIMTQIMGRTTPTDYAKLAAFQLFNLVTGFRDWRNWPRQVAGKIAGAREILHRRKASGKELP